MVKKMGKNFSEQLAIFAIALASTTDTCSSFVISTYPCGPEGGQCKVPSIQTFRFLYDFYLSPSGPDMDP